MNTRKLWDLQRKHPEISGTVWEEITAACEDREDLDEAVSLLNTWAHELRDAVLHKAVNQATWAEIDCFVKALTDRFAHLGLGCEGLYVGGRFTDHRYLRFKTLAGHPVVVYLHVSLVTRELYVDCVVS